MSLALRDELLQAMRAWETAGLLRPLDRAFARFIVDVLPEVEASALLAAALISQHNSHGHVCLDLQGLLQDPGTIGARGAGGAHAAAERELRRWLERWPLSHWLEQLQACALAWASWTPEPEGAAATPLVIGGSEQRPLLYLRRYWHFEQRIARGIEQRLQQHHAWPEDRLSDLLQGLFADSAGQTPDWQKIACALAARSGFALITGGPGTGKTTTVVRLLGLLQGLRLLDAQAPLQIRLVAPTGKAAARLNQSIAGSVQQLPWPDALSAEQGEAWRAAIPTEVTTLHRLLGAQPGSRHFRHHRGNPLALDLVVVDEASMVDVELMAQLLAALPAQAGLILLGDKDQLASVEAGSVLGDLCRLADAGHYRPQTRDWIERVSGARIEPALVDEQGPDLLQATALLRHSYRFAAHPGIGRLASLVNGGAGRVEALRQLCSEHSWQAQPERGSLHYLPLSGHSESHPDAALKTLITEGYAPYLQRIGEAMPHSEEPAAWDAWALTVFAAHRQFQVLTALRSGPFGVEGINRLAYRALRVWLEQQSYPEALHWPELPGLWYLGRPVLVTGNDYALKLMNGDVGICLWRPDPGQPGQRLALVAFADGEGGVRWVLPGRLQNIETVFAMTVHKSQGSEFSHSLLVLPDTPSPVLTKELLYTGITRASRRFTLACADDGVLQQTLNARVQRASGLDSAAAMKDATS